MLISFDMKKRGNSLVSVLLASSLCVLLAFTVAGVSISHLGVANRLENAQIARLNAEAAAQHLIGLICENPKLGTPQGAATDALSFEIPVNDGLGRVTFAAGAYDMPASFNNLASNRAVSGWKRTLPPHSMQIISRGIFRNEVRTLESILVIPPYKYALATTGEFRSNGALQVMGIESLDDLGRGPQEIPKDKIKPGHLASNSDKVASDDPAVDLKADSANPTLITGDAVAVGSLSCDSDFVTIEGAPRGGSEPAVIPDLKFENYDPSLLGSGYQNLSNGTFNASMNVTSAVRRQGDLTVRGGLHLDDGYLYVDGNVSIEGGVHGKGMIISTGNVSVHGRATLGAIDSVGLAAKGDVELIGQAANQRQMNGNTFRGVVYTEGDFKAQGLQLVGTVLGNKKGPQGSEMDLTNVNLIHHPGTISADWSNGWEPDLGEVDPYWSIPSQWGVRGNPDDFKIDKIVFNHHSSALGDLAYTPEQMQALEAAHKLPAGLRERSENFSRKVFAHEREWVEQSNNHYPAGFPREPGAQGGEQLRLPAGVDLSEDPLLTETPWFRLANAQVEKELARGRVTDPRMALDGTNTIWWTIRNAGSFREGLTTRGPLQFAFQLQARSGKVFNSPCDYMTYVYDQSGADITTIDAWFNRPDHESQFRDLIAEALRKVYDYDEVYRRSLESRPGRSILDGSVTLDPNQFIQLQDKMKRVLVREVTP
ncbi:MAG: hypothetical protein J0I12_21140 [Candidatus Eremiobacteraeota bacterium]|mgnify:CR=1 FL=1|nr:hypothetical protein [Candidatus Eremiobacteraeota bacterium]